MKANELRIGNLVYYESENDYNKLEKYLCKIDGEDIHKIDREENYANSHKPIPLTEEWLLKFGFEKDGFDWIIKLHYDTELILNFGKYSNAVIQDNEDGDSISLHNPKYVHQLQNLFFALTGKELTIKN